ncbi:RadC family protein [Parasphingopyxis marina]|uniref:DNA repair protein RadC n=1 Tax=Parasphingopyxis marina TaxID=2761622 RepID=A0A842HYL0_9SPHN|nr:DNA repair protein RadC [Parasphingopyxis marina]MBC2778226.1 DNA repair protein RadC [Parasphingopyxis marina]
MADAPTDGTGHRARLRKRLIEGGHGALLDHELVEYLLALAIPRRDTKPLAKKLLNDFGGLGPLLSAEPEALARIGGLSEGAVAALMIAKTTALRLLAHPIRDKPVFSNWQALIDYLRADMAHEPIERVRALYLDSKNVLIRDELVTEGSIDQAAVYVREIIRKAIDLHASALILVHNHPSGDPAPSKADIRLTRELIEAARPLDIAVHDHLIVGLRGESSMRSQGLI